MSTLESNQMRRAHRINIPLTVVIKQEPYTTKDWSMTGVGLVNCNLDLTEGEILDAAIIIVLQEARIEMPVQLQFKSKRGDVSGFEFYKISQRNKHVLREFLELSIEGKLDHIDSIVNIYNEPIIDTPITESVVLTDEEQSVLKQKFAKRSKFYITIAIIFFLLILATIYYNTSYIYRSIGTVSGNFIRVAPSSSGKVSAIYVKPGENVRYNTLLFELDNKLILDKINLVESKINELKNISHLENKSIKKSAILNLIAEDYKLKREAYTTAKELYQEHYITKKSLYNSYTQYMASKVKYLQSKGGALPTSAKAEASLISLMTKLQLQRTELLTKLKNLRIFSPADGTIYAVKIKKDDYIAAGDISMIIETRSSSFVVCKVKQEEALKIHEGMDVKVYDEATDKTYDAYVENVGNLSLNTQSHITNEVSLKEVTIKILFKDKNVKLPLNERVRIWFHRPLL